MFTEAAARAGDLLQDHLGLWDWRRRVAELYAEIRAFHDPEFAWRLWRAARDELFRAHPQSPLDPHQRRTFAGLALFDYDPAFRCVVDLAPAPEADRHELAGGRDGYVQLIPFARTDGLRARFGGELTLYWLGGYGGGVFLPFRDATTGRTTFGGGRYLLDGIKGADLGMDAGRPRDPRLQLRLQSVLRLLGALDLPARAAGERAAGRDHRRRAHVRLNSLRHDSGAALRRGSSVRPSGNRAPLRCPALFGENGIRRR